MNENLAKSIRYRCLLATVLCHFASTAGCTAGDAISQASLDGPGKGDENGDDGGGDGGSESASAAQAGLVGDVIAIFERDCASCHNPAGDFNVLDVPDLIERELVEPGKPEKSVLFEQVESGDMPQGGDRLSDEDVDTLRRWIDKGALAPESTEKREFIKEAELHRLAAEDLTSNYEGDERKNVRYFSLAPLYNGGAPQKELDQARQGLGKLMNSLSKSARVVALEAVDPAKVLYRAELDNYEWDPERWETLIKTYRYQLKPNEKKYLGILQADTGTAIPVLRADWFLAKASVAPLYYQLLQMAGTVEALEGELGVTTAQNLVDKSVIRAGFDDSGVSPQHRVIERHDAPNGVYWRSYEFGTQEGKQNIFENPLGPNTATAAATGADGRLGGKGIGGLGIPGLEGLAQLGGGPPLGDPHAFDDDGGEFIFSLQNGMLAFFIAGADGQRLNDVPVEEGQDPIIAGGSCMVCHARGFISKEDQVREKTEGNSELSSARSIIEQIYVDYEEFKSQIDDDSEQYRKALEKAGVNPDARDPISRVASSFSLDVRMSQAAAELGVTRETFEDILKEDEFEEVSDLFEEGSIARSDFEIHYRALSEALQDDI